MTTYAAIEDLLDSSLFSGGTTSSLGAYPAALNGRGYVLDFGTDRHPPIKIESIPMLRSQADTSNVTGEQSLNPAALWRRTQNSWHKGAGQAYLDRDESDAARFNTSKGVDPWTKGKLSLLPDTILKRATANTNLYMVTVGTYLYLTDGAALYYSTNGTSYTAVTGMPAGTPTSMTTDGYNVYVCCTANGMYTTTRAAAAATQLVTTALASDSVVGYVKGRLMVSKGAAIYNITSTSAAALPTALFTQNNTDFVWVGFAEGVSNAYAAGYSGDKSLIYRLPLKTDGTGLDVPIVAGELPDGEIVRSIQGYLGFLVIGTDKGVRFAEVDSTGYVTLGNLIPTGSAVRCFEPQDRFVWYGLTNYDSTSTGLGRLDLRTFNDEAPAYATDLMATTQGTVQAVVTFGSLRFFSVSGVGVYGESVYKVASATMRSGSFTYGVADQKVAAFVAVTTDPLVGTVAVGFARDNGSFSTIGTLSEVGSLGDEYPTDNTLSDRFEVQLTMAATGSTDLVGPVVTRFTAKANPAAATGYLFSVWIRLHEGMTVGGVEMPLVPSTELAILDELRLARRIVIWQMAGQAYTVTLEGIEWMPESLGRNNLELNGACGLTMKTLT